MSKGQTIASYHGHRGRLLCVQWSGSDPDVVFTGGEDFTFHKWRVSRNPYSAEDDGKVISFHFKLRFIQYFLIKMSFGP